MDSPQPGTLEERYPRGAVVACEVAKLREYGAEVVLPDGTKGIIRARELSWDSENRAPREVVQLGQVVRGLVLKVDRNRARVELSLRQAERDPWVEIESRLHCGQAVRGKVARIRERQAFVELEPGVTGLLPLEEMLESAPSRVDDVLWVGDAVEARILEFDAQKRHVLLSIRALRRARASAETRPGLGDHDRTTGSHFPIGEALGKVGRGQLLQLLGREAKYAADGQQAASNRHPLSAFHRVVIVDDDRSFRVSLGRLLKQQSVPCTLADSAEDAVLACKEPGTDLVLMDLGFQRGRMDGLTACKLILGEQPQMPVVVVTGIGWLERNGPALHEARQLGVRSAILKPVDWVRLRRILTAIAEGRDAWALAQLPTDLKVRAPVALQSMGEIQFDENTLGDLQRLVETARESTGADAAGVLSTEAGAGHVRACAWAGLLARDLDSARHDLVLSPIGDVLRDGKRVFEPDTTRNPLAFQHANLLEFRSFVGVPIETLAGLERYGLFLFHHSVRHFDTAALACAELQAGLIGAALSRGQVERVLRSAQPLMVLGQMSSALVHELNNRLGSLQNNAEVLGGDQALLSADPTAILLPRVRESLQECADDIRAVAGMMANLTHSYLNLVRHGEITPVDVNDLVRDVVRLLEPIAGEAEVSAVLDDAMPVAMLTGVHVQQILANLGLNAIQHTQHVKGPKTVTLKTVFDTNVEGKLPIVIQCIDNGNGIHWRHRDRIFDFGFSTRSHGTGLGLYIAKGLAESLGGELIVDDTIVLTGTIFTVRLPLIVPSSEESAE